MPTPEKITQIKEGDKPTPVITTKDHSGAIEFYWDNSAYLGYAYKEVDGCYVFVTTKTGAWAAYALRAIADNLDELNKKWDEQINNDPSITKPQ